MKKTAVEWLEKILKGQKEQPFDDYEWEIAFNHAKEMEKEQIIDAVEDGQRTDFMLNIMMQNNTTMKPLNQNK